MGPLDCSKEEKKNILTQHFFSVLGEVPLGNQKVLHGRVVVLAMAFGFCAFCEEGALEG